MKTVDVAARWVALAAAHKRTWRNPPARRAEYEMPDVIGGRMRARERAFRVAVARGQLNTLGRRPCSEAYPCWFHLPSTPPSPLLTGILSCGRAAKPLNGQAALDGSPAGSVR